MFNLSDWIEKQGYPAPSAEVRGKINTWLSWYCGYVSSFHDNTIYNGNDVVQMKRKSLEMAKYVCEDWANLLLNERVKIAVDKKFQKRLDELLKDSRFYLNANKDIELAFATGTGAFVEYKDADDRIVIDHYRADMICPLAWANGTVTECAFASVRTVEKKKAVYVMMHILDEGQYVIRNHMFDYETGAELALPDGVEQEAKTGSAVPLFQIIKPNIINTVDLDSPMGISVFANSISTLEALDNVYDSMDNEFRLGRKRLMIPMSMARIMMSSEPGKDGKPSYRPAFDSRDTVFYAIEGVQDDKKPVEINMQLRIDEHDKGLLDNLALLGKKVGVGVDRYTWDKAGGVKTATEVISDKSDLYQNLRKHELELEAALIGMVRALAFLDGHGEIAEINVEFDDSIIQDSQAELDNAIAKKNNGLISAFTIMTTTLGMTEDEANAELERIAQEQKLSMPNVDAFLTGSDRTDPPPQDDGQNEDGQEPGDD